MKLEWAMLANAAEIREGVAYVLSGGIDTVNTAELPTQFHGAVLVRLLLHRTEIGRTHTIEVRFTDEDGHTIAGLQGSVAQQPENPNFPVGWLYPVMMAVNISGLPLAKLGHYSVEVLADASHLATLNLRVVQVKPPATSA